jgi:hypothetical protein
MHASHIASRKRQIINPHFAFLGSNNPITRPATVFLAAPDSPTKSQQKLQPETNLKSIKIY